jgi:hypothetical protein
MKRLSGTSAGGAVAEVENHVLSAYIAYHCSAGRITSSPPRDGFAAAQSSFASL